MEISLKKGRDWIDFEYKNKMTDLISGKDFQASFDEINQVLKIKIDCSHNLRERLDVNNKADAQSFVDRKHSDLRAVNINDDYIYKNLSQFVRGNKITRTELILIFDKDYRYQVSLSGENKRKICIIII